MHLYASMPDFILQNNRAVKIMHFNLSVNNLSYRIEFWLFVDNMFVAFLLRPTVPTKVWTGAYTPTLSFLEVGSI
jgi:hypothetical protein